MCCLVDLVIGGVLIPGAAAPKPGYSRSYQAYEARFSYC